MISTIHTGFVELLSPVSLSEMASAKWIWKKRKAFSAPTGKEAMFHWLQDKPVVTYGFPGDLVGYIETKSGFHWL